MPTLNVVLKADEKTRVHANPQDSVNNSIPPYGGYTYTPAIAGIVTLTPTPDFLHVDIAPVAAGSTDITIQGQGVPNGPYKTTVFSVTVQPGPLDHFAPTADPPSPV